MYAQLEYVCTLHTCFCTFGTDLHAPTVLIDKISASELSQKFIKSVVVLLVGKVRTTSVRHVVGNALLLVQHVKNSFLPYLRFSQEEGPLPQCLTTLEQLAQRTLSCAWHMGT